MILQNKLYNTLRRRREDKVRNPVTKPGRDGGAKALRKKPKKYEDDARPDREPNGTGLRRPPSFSNHLDSREVVTSNWGFGKNAAAPHSRRLNDPPSCPRMLLPPTSGG